MNKIGLIVKREYTTRVRKKSFILMTVLTPILFAGLIAGTVLLAQINSGEQKTILVVDETGEYFPILHDTEQYHFVKEKAEEEIYASLTIGDLQLNPSDLTLYSEKQIVGNLTETISSQLNNYLSDKKLASYNIPDLKRMIEESKISVEIQTIRLDGSSEGKITSADVATAIGMFFTFLIYTFIFAYGAMVMQGVMEEKTNRIIEVIVSSVKPFELMMGKLIGIGLVGLTQFAIWGALIAVVLGFGSLLMTDIQGFPSEIFTLLLSGNLVEIVCFFIVFFICGYLIYASFFAAIGAMVNNPEDAQQFMMPLTIIILFALYTGMYSAQNPDGPLAIWSSLFPFTSPIVMMTRLPYGVPWWQMTLSIGLLVLTVILMVKLAAKIYRTGILMYGKKPTWSELIKWLKY
ncbi:MAG: ABC transporter permease [Candidatus Symbiothrix sp.]|jgi:ABC-2 type transport system permease protein|nr:ABC transporter permease [Candidatus Symbiothrix sp.]